MSHVAGRRRRVWASTSRPSSPLSRAAAVAVVLSALAGTPFTRALAEPQAQQRAVKPAAKVAGKQATKPARKPAAPKPPVAAKNLALGPNAVPAQPKAFLSQGCLDATHGQWLSGELAQAGDEWRQQVGNLLSAELAQIGTRPSAEAAQGSAQGSVEVGAEVGAEVGVQGSAQVDMPPPAVPGHCLPFASVRSPSNRIESLALLPAAVPAASAAFDSNALRRVMMVSRLDLASAPAARWLDLGEAPAGYREVWLSAAAVLGGEMAELAESAESVPQRWQRDVSVLVRQMKKQPEAADTAWVRVTLQGEGDGARVSAVELVAENDGHAIDSAIWLDRDDGPGGFVSAHGGDYERVLWQSPVDYRRISRGVGQATVIVRRRVLAKPKTPNGKPRTVIRSFRTRGQHQGVDFAAPQGTPVVAVADGTVVHAGRNGGYGNLVVVDHGGGVTTYYAHLSAFSVQEGGKVERGQEIGQVGSTGRSTGPHLHYEIRKDDRYLDPADPAQTLPNWSLAADEHQAALARLLSLSLSRQQAFARASRPAAVAAALPSSEAE